MKSRSKWCASENDVLFDIGADAVGTVLPGVNVAIKLGRLAARKVVKYPKG